MCPSVQASTVGSRLDGVALPRRAGRRALPRRAGRRTNVVLLGLLAVAFITGLLGYGVGTPAASAVIAVVHALVGLALVVLGPWKRLIVRQAWGRDRNTGLGVALIVLATACLATGIAHGGFGWAATDGLLLQIHVGAAVGLAALVVAHVARHPQRIRRTDLSRRNMVRALALGGGAAAAYTATHGAATALALPGAEARATGSTEVGSGRPDVMPVTQWFLDTVPNTATTSWDLVIQWPGGQRVIPYDQLAAANDEVRAVLDCTGGWYAEQMWRGLRLHRLLPDDVPGRSLKVSSSTGYSRRLPLRDAPTLLLATHLGGAPLSPGHGAPVRLVAPGRRGFWWVKWVERVEVSYQPWWLQPPLPLR
jgi:Oxidoreductase molybdopterin binding domain